MTQRGIAITRCPFVLYDAIGASDPFRINCGSVDSSGRLKDAQSISTPTSANRSASTPWAHDAALMRSITSAIDRGRVPCRRPVRPAPHDRSREIARRGHRRAPGFPDLVGFGRRELQVSPAEAEDFVLYQIAAVAGVAAAEGVEAAAREAARGAVQHGGAGSGAGRGDRQSRGRVRSVADPVRPGRLRDPQRRPRRRTSRRRRDLRRSRIRAGRIADATKPSGRRDSRCRRGGIAGDSHDDRARRRRHRRHDRADRGRHHLRARRHTRRRGARRRFARPSRSRGRHRRRRRIP